MADYANVSGRLDRLLDLPDSGLWFNSLPFRRVSPTFLPSPEGSHEWLGQRGEWTLPGLEGLAEGVPASLPEVSGWLCVTEAEDGLDVETPFYRLRLAPDGSFLSLFDLTLNREWVREGCGFNKLHIWEDHPGMYDAWDILPNYKDVAAPLTVVKALHLEKETDSFAVFAADLATGSSSWQMRITLFAQGRAIDVAHSVDWHEKHRLAKVNFGPDVLTREVLCDTSAGYIHRSLTKNTTWEQARFEVCHHKWFDLSESGSGLAVINREKYGLGLEGDEVNLSLLRATIRPDITSDMGHHEISYRILPHRDGLVEAGVNRLAFEYNVPLLRGDASFPESLREMILRSGLWLQSLKRSEGGHCLVVRLSEQDGRRGRFSLPFPAVRMNLLEDAEETVEEVTYKPFELITLGIKIDL